MRKFDPRFPIKGTKQKIIHRDNSFASIRVFIERLRRQSKLHLQELLNIKQFITNIIYGSPIFRRRERAGDIDIERRSSTESFGWDRDGIQSIDILGQKWLCTTKKSIKNWNITLLRPLWFSMQGPKHWTGKTCWEKLFVYSHFDREDSTVNCGGNRVLFPASAISATEDFGSRHKNENIERTVYESTNIVWHPGVRYPNVCFDEKEFQCQENSFDSRIHSFSSPIRFRRPQLEPRMFVLKNFSR